MGSSIEKAVQGTIKEAIDHLGKAQALALRVQELLGRSYNHRTVSAWARGDAMPPADALLAAAQATDISLDAKLGIGREPSESEKQLEAMRQEMATYREQMDLLRQRMDALIGSMPSDQ
jgi:transcriptional regulator with XRE-family HTH domain